MSVPYREFNCLAVEKLEQCIQKVASSFRDHIFNILILKGIGP